MQNDFLELENAATQNSFWKFPAMFLQRSMKTSLTSLGNFLEAPLQCFAMLLENSPETFQMLYRTSFRGSWLQRSVNVHNKFSFE